MSNATDTMSDAGSGDDCDMDAQNESPVLKYYETNDMTYEFTATTFKKTSRLPFNDPLPDGTPFVWSRSLNHDRITNEAKAIRLVTKKTTIPVPKLLGYGEYPDGRRYLITELIEGVPLHEFRRRGCSKPRGQTHADSIPCETCLNQAYSNALKFIEGSVLPQIANLTSQDRGLDGFVMPPSWLSPDIQPPWKGKKYWKTLHRKKPEYVFQHGDIAAHNIMMDPKTLQPKVLFDWEYAGYFPLGMERWPRSLDLEDYRKRSDHLASAIANFLPTEYLECYDNWSDKVELDRLIKSGELPHPDQLRLA